MCPLLFDLGSLHVNKMSNWFGNRKGSTLYGLVITTDVIINYKCICEFLLWPSYIFAESRILFFHMYGDYLHSFAEKFVFIYANNL